MSTRSVGSGSSGANSARHKTLRKKAITKAMDKKDPATRVQLPSALPVDESDPAVVGGVNVIGAVLPAEGVGTVADIVITGENDLDEELDKLGIARPTPRTDDDWSDADSVCSRRSGRRSSLLPSFAKRTGISMDLASQRANELLQSAKESLERAGNMKRECKLEALESLQEMYEIVLTVSDSRSRHRVSLEQERARAARELVRVERAHTKTLADISQSHAAKLQEAHEVIMTTHQTAEAIRGWLNYEMDGPIKGIASIQNELHALAATSVRPEGGPIEMNLKEHLGEVIKRFTPMFSEMTDQLRTMRAAVDDLTDKLDKAERLRLSGGPEPLGSTLDAESLLGYIRDEMAGIRSDLAKSKPEVVS